REKMNAEVVSVLPNKVKIVVNDLKDFQLPSEKLKVGSYVRISDSEDAVMLAIIENYSIESILNAEGEPDRRYILEANPLGILRDDDFERGGDTIAIPPKDVKPATRDDIDAIYAQSIADKEKFVFANLASNPEIAVPVNGNKFFNKHIAIVGSTGSGKSHTVAKIIQSATTIKEGTYDGMNNSHIIIFDIHSEYKAAFPNSNYLDVADIVLPYWLLNSEELQELFLDTEANDHNQRNVFKEAVIDSKISYFKGSPERKDRINFDSPLLFDIKDVLSFAQEKNNEMVQGKNGPKQGPLNGKLSNFISRLENRISDKRLTFLLGDEVLHTTFENTIKQFIGYGNSKSNITIIDLSGVPFEVLSITVSLISRLLFEFGYYYKRLRHSTNPNETINNDTPFLLVYEEAHKYVPNSDLVKYRASRESIERIAKEGRKYGITLMLASQRPSEISETIFSQCNNFITMRLTNPNDQNYVKRLLPDTMGQLIDKMPTLKSGECLLIGDAVIIPSIVKIEECNPKPSSNDIPYLELWKQEWLDLDIQAIVDNWRQ
ncbi:MAG: ATP-binding protein, partial [Huintestinicola sp.]